MNTYNSTPLLASTSRRDIINSPANKSSPITDDLSSLTITSGKLKDLETDIAAESVALSSLKDSITKSEQISYRLTRMLGTYETRMGEVERIVMPVYRNILNMAQMNDRIEGTIGLVEHLMKINEQVRKEVVILLPGPMMDNLLVYLDSITRLESINHELAHSELGYCKISLERTATTISDARGKVEAAFQSWLGDAKTQGTSALISGSNESIPEVSSKPDIDLDYLAQLLQTIVNFSLNSPSHFSALIIDWIEIRSNYLAASCEALFAQAQAFEKDPNGYRPGSHPLPRAFEHARSLLQAEELFMSKVWPTTAIGPTFLRSAQIARDLAVSTVEAITGKMKKALVRREYADQVYLFNVLGQSYTSVFSATGPSDSSLAVQVLVPSLKYFVTTTASLLTDLIGEIRGTIPRAIERPFVIPQNATVYELTSLTVNVLKRIERDDVVVDSILQGQSSNNWDGTLNYSNTSNNTSNNTSSDTSSNTSGNIGSNTNSNTSSNTGNNTGSNTLETPHHLPAISRFFTDILGSLESSIDAKSKTLRRPMQTLLFQLNNYNYLAKGVGVLQSGLVDGAVVKRYEQIIEALKRSFFNSWSMIANLITSESSNQLQTSANTPSPAKSAPKDRLKAFTLEFDESVMVQQACSVPDAELKTELKSKIKELITAPYILFYNQNQALFLSYASTSKYHDPDHIDDMISHLFEG